MSIRQIVTHFDHVASDDPLLRFVTVPLVLNCAKYGKDAVYSCIVSITKMIKI